MADILIHIRRLIQIILAVYVCGIVCEDLTCSLYPRATEHCSFGGRSSISGGVGGCGSAGSGSCEEDSVPIEIPRKFHLQLWIYIYSFLIYAVLVNITVL